MTDPVRIALLTNFVPPYRRPVFEALSARVDALRIVVDVAMEDNRPWAAEWGDLDVRVQRSLTLRRNSRGASGHRDVSYLHVPIGVLAELIRFRPDVVVSGEFGIRTMQAVLYRLLRRRSRLVVWATLSEHTESTRGRFRGAIRRFILGRADGVITNGASGGRYLTSLGFDADKVHVVHQVADPRFARPAASPVSPPPTRFVIVGQLIERKGLEELFTALDPGALGNAEFDVVGSGPLEERLRGLVDAAGLPVRLHGELAPDDLAGVYGQAHYLVLPTLADEWGLVVNEALAAGLPVLGSRWSQAVEELVRPGENGWVFDPTEPQEVRSAVDAALSVDAGEQARMAEESRRTVEDMTPETCADRIVAACAAATAGTSRTAAGRCRRRAANLADLALSRAGLVQSEDKLVTDARDYWTTSTGGEHWRDQSHWRGGSVIDDDRFLRIGQENLDLFERLARTLDEPASFDRVVEWGAGGGANAVAFAPRALEFVAVDIVPDTLSECVRQVKAVCDTPVVSVLASVDDPESSVLTMPGPADVFLCLYVMELLPSPEYGLRIMRIAADVLRDGGLALVQTRYDDGSLRGRSRGRGYERHPSQMTAYRVEEFWTRVDELGLEPLVVRIAPRTEFNETHAYYLLRRRPR